MLYNSVHKRFSHGMRGWTSAYISIGCDKQEGVVDLLSVANNPSWTHKKSYPFDRAYSPQTQPYKDYIYSHIYIYT